MNFGQLRASVSYILDDLNFGYFTQTQVNLWLNNAQQEVQKKLIRCGQNFYTITVSTSTEVNCQSYVLPQDFKKLHRLDLVVNGSPPNQSVRALTPITWNMQDLIVSGSGVPTCYAIQKNRLVLFRAPDSATYLLRLTYDPILADMVLDTDIPDIEADYHQLIALYAAQDGFIKDFRVSETLLKKIAEYETAMDRDANERRQDSSREIRVVSDNTSGTEFYY